MASVNKVIIIGNLGADPETRTFQNGNKVCNLRIATSESWKDRDGNRQERTEWHSVAIFSEGLAGVAERFLRKGSKVYLEGQLRTRKWQDQQGQDRYSTEVVLQGPQSQLVMLDGPPAGSGERRREYDDRDTEPAPRPSGASRGGGRSGADRESGGWGGGRRTSPPRRDEPTPGGWDDLDDDIPF